MPGTTRDVIEEVVNIGGFPFVVRDTAGIRRTEDVVEKIGVERAIALMEGADLVLCVVDGSSPLEDDDISLLQQVQGKTGVLVVNKKDIGSAESDERYRELLPDVPIVRISAETGEGFGRAGGDDSQPGCRRRHRSYRRFLGRHPGPAQAGT